MTSSTGVVAALRPFDKLRVVPKTQSEVEGSKVEPLASDKKHEKSQIDFEEQAF